MITAANASVSGRVKTAQGRGIADATLKIEGGILDSPRYAQTGSFGYYHFDDLAVGQTYIITVSSKHYDFINPTRVISLQGDITGADFISQQDDSILNLLQKSDSSKVLTAKSLAFAFGQDDFCKRSTFKVAYLGRRSSA